MENDTRTTLLQSGLSTLSNMVVRGRPCCNEATNLDVTVVSADLFERHALRLKVDMFRLSRETLHHEGQTPPG